MGMNGVQNLPNGNEIDMAHVTPYLSGNGAPEKDNTVSIVTLALLTTWRSNPQ